MFFLQQTFSFCFLRQDTKHFLANYIRRFNVSAFQAFQGGCFCFKPLYIIRQEFETTKGVTETLKRRNAYIVKFILPATYCNWHRTRTANYRHKTSKNDVKKAKKPPDTYRSRKNLHMSRTNPEGIPNKKGQLSRLIYVPMASSISLIFMNSSAVCERDDSPGPSLNDGNRIRAWSLSVGEPKGFLPMPTSF